MKTLIGLGNPGKPYAETRHNVGWMAIERLAAAHAVALDRRLRQMLRVLASYGQGSLDGETVRLVKPLTMMNRSGEAVAALQRRERDRVSPETVLIVCDDVNLPLGRLRMRPEGGAGGHNGLSSCLRQFGQEAVPRLRIGVGGGAPGKDLAPFVLAPFAESEKRLLGESLARAVEACELWVTQGVEAAMNRANVIQENR